MRLRKAYNKIWSGNTVSIAKKRGKFRRIASLLDARKEFGSGDVVAANLIELRLPKEITASFERELRGTEKKPGSRCFEAAIEGKHRKASVSGYRIKKENPSSFLELKFRGKKRRLFITRRRGRLPRMAYEKIKQKPASNERSLPAKTDKGKKRNFFGWFKKRKNT